IMGAIQLTYLGETGRAKEWALRALSIDPEYTQDSYDLACALAQLNELEQALSLLETYAEKMPPGRLEWVKRDADLEPLRGHLRYKALIARAEKRFAALRVHKPAKPKGSLN